jgi:DNA-binding NtrC family response regulator
VHTILVVEDESMIRLYVADYLRECDFNVVEAADAATAMQILDANDAVHLVFTDITLPGQPDGLGLAEWIRARKPGLPLVLTSGKVTAESARQASNAPFFAKPCDYAEVASAMRRMLGQRNGD